MIPNIHAYDGSDILYAGRLPQNIFGGVKMISASLLYDLVGCPQRVHLDAFGDPARRDEPNEFVEMLWQGGVEHEEAMLAHLGITCNLARWTDDEREIETLAAMARGERLIYHGRLVSDDLVGESDLLEAVIGGYVPGDIKSGGGLEGEGEGGDDGRPKKTYSVQLAHYVNLLETLGWSDGRREAYVIDREGARVAYRLGDAINARDPQTWWEFYLDALAIARGILDGTTPTRGALSAACKLCHWGTACEADLVAAQDLTLVAELGRAKRDVLSERFPDLRALAAADPEAHVRGKKTDFPGIGPDTLRKYHARAVLLSTPGARPYLKAAVNFPVAAKEIAFDIEDDPLRANFLYLHGFVERPYGGGVETFRPQFARDFSPAAELQAFAAAWAYLSAEAPSAVIYYFSKYERTAYRRLAERYPEVCSVDDVNALFALPTMIDLYDVVRRATEWPCYSQGIKTLAQFLGFRWRDPHPSGAASIQWFHEFTRTGDPAVQRRVLEYNEDDCRATFVVVDGIRAMPTP